LDRWGSIFRSIELALPVGLLILAFLVAAFAVRNSDAWHHLAVGRLIAQGAYTFGVDPFSFTTEGVTWVNHSWLYDFLTYFTYINAGPATVIAIKGVAVAVIIGLLVFQRPTGQPIWVWALFGTLALLTIAPRLILQPAIVSTLLLPLLMLILTRAGVRSKSYALPLMIGGIIALWANCDQWFFLGPLTVTLFMLGELLQVKLGKSASTPISLPVALITVVVSWLAPLLNPHHIGVYALPVELVSAQFAIDLESERYFRPLFQTPFDPSFYSAVATGNIINPMAYFALLLTSALGLGLNYSRARWSGILIWGAMALLSLIHARAVPFFAVIAAPLAAQAWCELGNWLWNRSSPLKEVNAGLQALMQVVMGMFGVLLLLMAWPGWLNSYASNPNSARRVAFTFDAEPSMVRLGEQLTAWRAEDLITPAMHGFQSHSDMANFLAWFAPTEPTFMDSRFTLHEGTAANYAQVRNALRVRAQSDEKSAVQELRRVLRDQKIDYVILNTKIDTDEMLTLVQNFWIAENEWTMWYIDGRTVVFGWNDPDKAPIPANEKLRFNPVAEAFSGDIPPVPTPTEFRPLADQGFFNRYLIPAPPTPLEIDEAVLLNRYLSIRRQIGELQARQELFARGFVTGATMMQSAFLTGNVGLVSPEVSALAVLSVRAARRAIAASPDNSAGYFALAEAYGQLPMIPDQRRLQVLTALQRAIDRSPPPEQATSQQSFLPFEASMRASAIHREMGQYDLALRSLQRAIAYLEKAPPIQMELKQISEQIKRLREFERWDNLAPEEVVSRRSDEYENRTARQASIQVRTQIARQFGLWGEAIDVYQKAIAEDRLVDEFGPSQPLAVADLIQLQLLTGQAEEAWSNMRSFLEKDGVISVDNLPADPPAFRQVFRDRMLNAAWLVGDYVEASAQTDVILRTAPLVLTGDDGLKLVIGSLAGLSGHWPTQEILLLEYASQLYRSATYEGEYNLRRALLCVESGDNPGAIRHFKLALKPHGYDVRFVGQDLASEYLRVMGAK